MGCRLSTTHTPKSRLRWRSTSVSHTGVPVMAIIKTEVVSVRVEPRIKAALQSAAEREMRSVANMLEVMVVAYCRDRDIPVQGDSPDTLPAMGGREKA